MLWQKKFCKELLYKAVSFAMGCKNYSLIEYIKSSFKEDIYD